MTAACIQDRDAVHRLLAAVCARFATITLVFADGGYAGRLVFLVEIRCCASYSDRQAQRHRRRVRGA
ncbi:hypothetical protein AB4305_34060 [Nocardia sp. 2YAB30]|uniref:hypothetical protein n=1 Tax=Nocardia sp. 2YAB30 TaxID=3233022 RepID=UPI003F976CA8